MKFRVMEGAAAHQHHGPSGDGQTYSAGETFESDLELDKLFVNKFERVDDAKKKPAKGKKTLPVDEDEPAPHSEDFGEEVSPAERTAATIKASKEAQEASEDDEGEEGEKEAPKGRKTPPRPKKGHVKEDEGDDATENFPKAGDNDLKVTHQKGKGYTVEEDGKPLNDKPLKTKKQVEAFLDSHLDGDDSEDD